MSRSYTKRLSSIYSKQISTILKISMLAYNLMENNVIRSNCILVENNISISLFSTEMHFLQIILFTIKSVLAEKLVAEAHLQTIHGGGTSTMSKIRDQFWIPTLSQLAKRIIKGVTGANTQR